jgi:hypothetical protein
LGNKTIKYNNYAKGAKTMTDPLEALREQIDAIFLSEYTALHDNIFHSEFEASKAASVKVMDLLIATLEAVCNEVIGAVDLTVENMPGQNNDNMARNGLRTEQRARLRELLGGSK